MQRRQGTVSAHIPIGLALLALAVATSGVMAEESATCHDIAATQVDAASASSSESEPSSSTDRPRLAGGFRAHVDPLTGSLVTPPPAALRLQLSPDLQQAFSTSADGLVEVALPNGGVMVRLDGRFMSATVATVGADGQVRIGHGLPVAAAPAPETATGAGEENADDTEESADED